MLKLYAMIGVGVAFLAIGGYAKYQHWRAGELKTKLEASESLAKSYKASADSKDVTIAKQNTALQQWKQFEADTEQKSRLAAEKSRTESQALAAFSRRVRALEAKDYELPDCVKYLALDVAAVCPNHASSLRERATHYH